MCTQTLKMSKMLTQLKLYIKVLFQLNFALKFSVFKNHFLVKVSYIAEVGNQSSDLVEAISA